MDGTEQEITARSRKFANRLHNLSRKPVHQYDERLSTVEAKSRLFELGGIKKLAIIPPKSATEPLELETF